MLKNLLTSIQPNCTQEERTEDTLLTINLGIDEMLLIINLKLQPRTPIRNDPGRVDIFFVGKNDTGRTVDLTDHNAFCSVDNKCATIGHQRDIPKEDFLFSHLSIGELEADRDFDGYAIGSTLLLALHLGELDVVIVDCIPFVSETHLAIGTINGEC